MNLTFLEHDLCITRQCEAMVSNFIRRVEYASRLIIIVSAFLTSLLSSILRRSQKSGRGILRILNRRGRTSEGTGELEEYPRSHPSEQSEEGCHQCQAES